MFIAGQLLMSLGTAPLFSLGITYLCDNIEERSHALFTGKYLKKTIFFNFKIFIIHLIIILHFLLFFYNYSHDNHVKWELVILLHYVYSHQFYSQYLVRNENQYFVM
jgi:hypothetical protein